MTEPEEQEWLTTNEAADLMGYDSSQVRRLLIAGKVEGQKFGRDWMVNRESLLAYKEQTEQKGQKRGRKPSEDR